jgi:hypothetical protein
MSLMMIRAQVKPDRAAEVEAAVQNELPLESWRVPYAAAGRSTAIFSYSMGDINAAEVCRRLAL